MRKYIVIIVLMLASAIPSYDGRNPERPPVFTFYGKKEAKSLAAMMAAQGLEAEGHRYISRKVDDIAELQQKLYDALTHYQSTLQMAACTYAIVDDFAQTIRSAGDLAQSMTICPTGIFASLVQGQKSRIWKDALTDISGICSDVCMLVKRPAYQNQRYDMLKDIQQKIQAFNYKLQVLSNMVRYTSLVDVWYAAVMKARGFHREDPGTVALRSMEMTSLRVREMVLVRNHLQLPVLDGFSYMAR